MAGLHVPLSTLRHSPRGPSTHDLGPSWIATPSMSGVLIPFLMPVYPGAFPTFTMCRSAGVVPSFSPAASPRLRRSPSTWPSSPHDWRGSKSPRTLTRCRRALLPGPDPPGWSRFCCLRGFHHWFTRRCTVLPCLPNTDRLAVPARLDVVGAAPTRPLRFQGSGCPQLHRAAATAQWWALASHPVTPRLVAHGHVPVQPRDLHAEGGDRAGPHRPHKLVEFGRDRVQGAADAVVVERLGRDTERLLDCPGPRPVLHPPQRRRGGQPVGHQRTDHLPVGQGGHLPDRAGPVHDPCKVKALAEAGHHRQRPQQLLHTGRAVAGTLPTRSLSWSLGRHRGTLAGPKPHQHNNSGMFRSIPARSAPRLRMCEGRD